LKQSTLIQEDKRQLQSTQWLNNGNVLLQDGSGKAWWMNPTTGALTEVK
jgi:hypothetical protein